MLSMAITLKGNKNIDALAIDTDGIDGVEDNCRCIYFFKHQTKESNKD